MADTFILGDCNQTWTVADPPEPSTAGTETSGSGVSTCFSTFSKISANIYLSAQSTNASSTQTEAETTRKELEDLNALLASATDTRITAISELKDSLSHLALHIKKLQEHHAAYHDQPGPRSRAGNHADLQMMIHHSTKRLEYQARIQETLDNGSQLIVKARNLLGEKAGLMGIEIDSEEMREWMDEWAGFGLELGHFQRLLNEAIMEGPFEGASG
ncbi:hypothetical protein KCU65_g9521, partial [Aureobasidium melanogenum]